MMTNLIIGPRKTFKIKEGDKIILRKIGSEFKNKNYDEFKTQITQTQSTVINFSVYQFLHRLKRIQIAEGLQSLFTKGKHLFAFLQKCLTSFFNP